MASTSDSMKREETKAIILIIFMFLDVEAIISILFMAVEHNFNGFYKRYQKSIHYSLFSLPKRFYVLSYVNHSCALLRIIT